jgi:hypothetical protein
MYVTDYLRIAATNLHTFGLVGKALARSACLTQKFYNFGHDGTLSIINFVLMMVQMLKSRFEPKCLVHGCLWDLWP